MEVSANNAEAVVEHPDYESNPSPSGSAVGTPASVRSLPSGHTPDDQQPHTLMTLPPISTSEQTSEQSHTVPTRRQQSSPAKLFADPQQPAQECIPTLDEATVTTATWDFTKCVLKMKNIGAATDWKFIGRQLGLEETDIEAIYHEYGTNLQEAFYQMMRKWKATKGEKATKVELIRALREENLTAIVEKIA